jgi:hypothetical protein
MILIKRQLSLGCCFGLLVASLENGRAAGHFNAGPLWSSSPLVLPQGQRTEAMGPFYYFERKETQEIHAFPPFFSYLADPVTDAVQFDFSYPVMTYSRYGTEYRWQFLQLLSFSGGQDQREVGRRRFTVFPIYFQQRSPDSGQNYTALVPFYGHLKGRLFRDEITFAMFPLYGRSRKGDVVTDNYLYPFFHLRRGEALEGWQFWPFTGREHKDVTARTNGFGDVETVGGHDSRFVVWPFFIDYRSGIGTENPQVQQSLLPFYSYSRSPARDSTTVLWPLITHTTNREKKYTEWQTPWPLIEFGRGEGKTVSRLWPLFSRAQSTNLESAFFLWPVYKYNRVHSAALDRDRTRILLFLYSDVNERNIETGAALHRVDFWPLFTHRRSYDGSSRLQLFSILEPLLPNSERIERDYSPLWSVWRSEKSPKLGATSQSLLWNLYRRDTAREFKKCSLLFGLFQYQSGSAGETLHLFYIPVVKTRPPAQAGAKQSGDGTDTDSISPEQR